MMPLARLSFIFLLLMSGCGEAHVERYVEGVHYALVQGATPPAEEKGTVMEFFSFGCPHCNAMEAHVQNWLAKKPDAVHFVRIPVQWNPQFRLWGQLFYTLENLGQERHEPAVYDYIHQKHLPLQNEEQIQAWFLELGGSAEDFQRAFHSDEVREKMDLADQAAVSYRISGVPAFIVNGRYFVNVTQAGSPEILFDVVNFLLEK